MRDVFFIMLVFCVFVLPGCRVHLRQVSQQSDNSEHTLAAMSETKIDSSRLSSSAAVTATASGTGWSYTETYYPPVPGDTLPRLQSRTWSGRQLTSEISSLDHTDVSTFSTSRRADTLVHRADTHTQITNFENSSPKPYTIPIIICLIILSLIVSFLLKLK